MIKHFFVVAGRIAHPTNRITSTVPPGELTFWALNGEVSAAG
jgi:hypothetical protein